MVWLGDDGGVSSGLAEDFGALLAMTAAVPIVAVDIPVGLPNRAVPGGRECDRQARKLLGPRASSVFPPPVYRAMACEEYGAAVAANRASSEHGLGISKQCFALFPRLRDVHDHMTPELQERIHEVHPELCFYGMNGCKPLEHPKKKPEGLNQRLSLLRSAGVKFPEQHLNQFSKHAAAPDDVLDAMAAAWTACRIAQNKALQIPTTPETDARGLRMEMWW